MKNVKRKPPKSPVPKTPIYAITEIITNKSQYQTQENKGSTAPVIKNNVRQSVDKPVAVLTLENMAARRNASVICKFIYMK